MRAWLRATGSPASLRAPANSSMNWTVSSDRLVLATAETLMSKHPGRHHPYRMPVIRARLIVCLPVEKEAYVASMDVPADPPVAAKAARPRVVKPTYITWMTLAFMTTASVASLRSAPTMAVYGLTCVFLYLVPAIIFLLPQSLVAAELASGWTGGVFRWVSEGLSPRWGLLAVWCQFAMTIFYYPTLLGFVASTLAYIFNPDLADNGVYTGIVIVVVFWLGVFLSARGGTGGIAKLASSGLLIGDPDPATAPRAR
jgi:hypothetical protein